MTIHRPRDFVKVSRLKAQAKDIHALTGRSGRPEPVAAFQGTEQEFLVVGNGQVALAVVRVLLQSEGAKLVALLTSEPTSRTAALAASAGVPVLSEALVRDPAALLAAGLPATGWLLCANTTMIVPAEVLARFHGRALNFHPGLLPAYAGLHTHQWGIRNGETEFGVTIHHLEPGLDTGAIIAVDRFPVEPEDTGLSLFARCISRGGLLFADVLAHILAGDELPSEPQDLRRRRLYRHCDAPDGQINWTWPARRIVDYVRAGNYHPFTSPTYSARLEDFGAEPVVVLRAVVAKRGGAPGRVLALGLEGPEIGCGAGESITLAKAMLNGKEMDRAAWQRLLVRLGPKPWLAGRGTGQSVVLAKTIQRNKVLDIAAWQRLLVSLGSKPWLGALRDLPTLQ